MKKKQILFIDDEPALCKFAKKNLERTGEFEVTTAQNGAEGIAKAKAGHFDLVITDFRMPEMDGEEVILAIEEMDAEKPIVLFSVYHDDPETVTPSTKSKVAAIISKPYRTTELLEQIRKIFSKQGR